jgi:signal transduction histidine kinase
MMTYRDLMLGRNVYIPSRVDYKNAMLRSQLAVIALIVGISYIFIDWYHGIYGSEPYYIGVGVVSIITLILNRLRKYKAATFLFLAMINLLIFYFSAIDPYGSGVFMFFAVSSLMAFALLGYHHLKLAFFFIFISVGLFLISYWVDFDFIEERVYPQDYLRISYTTNFLVSLICCIAIMYFLMDVNHHSEKEILAKNDQQQKANAELDRFVYSASHDLKAPLTSLLGLIEIAKLDQKETDQYLGMMRERIHNLEDFIQEIITYSRNSRTEIIREQAGLKKIVAEVSESLKFIDHTKPIVIENKIPDKTVIDTDITRLKVVLTNLISNSLKYADDRKDKCFIRIESDQSENATVIFVRDNGIGIDQKYLDKIYNMFFRATIRSKGSGLGLYIVKETLSRINGTIKVESELGEGTTFIVTLSTLRD